VTPRLAVNGVIASAERHAPGTLRQRLDSKMVRLLNLHARYRASAGTVTRLVAVGRAIDALTARISMIDQQRIAA
jgi:hypothetical protein